MRQSIYNYFLPLFLLGCLDISNGIILAKYENENVCISTVEKLFEHLKEK